MASPFKMFRKHQKLMLALLAILAMFGFVVLPMILQGMGTQRQTNPRVVTTAEYGDLTLSKLSYLQRQRRTTLNFLEALQQAVGAAGGNDWLVERVKLNIGSTSDGELVHSWLLARRAEQLGLVVDEKAIITFLRYLGQERVTLDEMGTILNRLQIRESHLFSALEQELLALRLREMFLSSLEDAHPLLPLPIATPAQRWDYFQRLERRVTIQSVPVRVSDFVDQVEDPDDSTLRKFFDRYKAEPYVPTSPEPGFREPQKIAVEYLKAEYDKFVDPDAVTGEEIKAYYEENKLRYRQVELPKLDAGEPEEPPAADSEPAAQQEDGEAVEPRQPTDQKTSEDAGADAAKPEPAGAGPVDGAAGDQQEPTATKAAEEAVPDPSNSGDTSLLEPASPFRLASFLQEDAPEEKSPEEDTPEEKAAETEPPTSGPELPVAEAAPAEKPAAEAAPEEEPLAEATPPEGGAAKAKPVQQPEAKAEPTKVPTTETAPAEKPAAPSAEAAAGTTKPAVDSGRQPADTEAPDQQMKYKPLEEVESEIRDELARQKAHEKIGNLLGEIQMTYLNRYRQELAKGSQPASVDFHALAKQYGLVSREPEEYGLVAYQPEKPELMSVLEARETDIGQSWTGRNTAFLRYAFEQQSLPEARPAVSRPAISQDANGDYYLFWKVDEVEERVPELDEPGVRERVLREWKMIQARSLAEDEAKRLRDEARKKVEPLVKRARKREQEAQRLEVEADRKLAEAQSEREEAERLAREARKEADRLWAEASEAFRSTFSDEGDAVVTESEPFTWLTYGDVRPRMALGPPRFSEVEGVDVPRHDFMRVVFGLKRGEIGTAMNDPKTVVYAVQVTESNPSTESLWDSFVNEAYSSYFRTAKPDNDSAQRAWLDAIKQEVGFQWDPDWRRGSWGSRGGYE